MKKILLHFLFAVIVIGDLIGEYLHSTQLDYIFKPLILVWIGMYFLLHARHIERKVLRLALLALLASWCGDLFMMFATDSIYFILGIASFMVAQALYAFLFLHTINLSGKKPFLKKKPFWMIPYISYGIIIYIVLFPHLGAVLRISVFVYFVAILTMSVMALNRYGNGHPVSFVMVFTGSLLFIVSDSLIAVNRFLVAIPFEGLLVMSTYIAAQYLIMRGLLMQYE
ncbi:lysoplasmalogenase [Maribellus mangrovi]|uniref:lysoplasmalogenase n=1 Tax=Maribellus mangrovi TaxID=3133146 RepID=UPI0030EC7D34